MTVHLIKILSYKNNKSCTQSEDCDKVCNSKHRHSLLSIRFPKGFYVIRAINSLVKSEPPSSNGSTRIYYIKRASEPGTVALYVRVSDREMYEINIGKIY